MKVVTGRVPATCERIAWWSLLAVPALLPVVIGAIPFASQPTFTQSPFIYPKIFVLALLVSISAVSWAYGVFRGKLAIRTVPYGWWLAGFLGLAVASTVFAMNPSMAFFGGRYQLIGLMSLLLATSVFLLMTQLLTTPGRLRALSWSTVLGGVVVAIVTILQARDLDPLGMARSNLYILHRGPSLLGNPDFTGTYLVVPVLIAAALALSVQGMRLRLLAWSCCAVTFLAVAMSLTRGAWVGVVAGAVALVVSAARTGDGRRNIRWLLVGGGVVLASAVMLRGGPVSFLSRFSDLSSASTAGDGRFVLWKDALLVVRQHPLFGTGPDSYRLGWYGVRSPASVQLSGISNITEDPHNIVLLLAATLGIPAALLAVGMVGATLVGAASTAFAKMAKPGQLVYSGWWAALLGLSAALFFGANTVVATVMLFIAAAVLLVPRVGDSSVTPRVARVLSAGMATLVSVLLALSTISFAADIRLGGAMASGDSAGMDAAARIAPWHVQAQYQATFAAATAALTALKDATPGAPDTALSAEKRIAALIAENPHEYYSQSLMAFFLAQSGAIQQAADGPQAVDTLKRAQVAATRALAISPVNAEAAYLKAFSEYHLEDNSAAIVTLQPIWDIDPRFASPGLLYVEVLERQGYHDRALAALATLQKRFPGDEAVAGTARALETSGTVK